jgi:hypothetical protein
MQKRTSLGGGSVSYHHVRSRPEAETGRAAAVRVENARCYTYTRGNEPVVLWQLAIEKPMSIWTAGESHYSVVLDKPSKIISFSTAIQKLSKANLSSAGFFCHQKYYIILGSSPLPPKLKLSLIFFIACHLNFLCRSESHQII